MERCAESLPFTPNDSEPNPVYFLGSAGRGCEELAELAELNEDDGAPLGTLAAGLLAGAAAGAGAGCAGGGGCLRSLVFSVSKMALMTSCAVSRTILDGRSPIVGCGSPRKWRQSRTACVRRCMSRLKFGDPVSMSIFMSRSVLSLTLEDFFSRREIMLSSSVLHEFASHVSRFSSSWR